MSTWAQSPQLLPVFMHVSDLTPGSTITLTHMPCPSLSDRYTASFHIPIDS